MVFQPLIVVASQFKHLTGIHDGLMIAVKYIIYCKSMADTRTKRICLCFNEKRKKKNRYQV